MTNKQIIDGKECRYWFRLNPDDYRKCSLRGKDDNCDEIKDCFIKELLGKLALKEQECEELKKQNNQFDNGINEQFSKIIELEGRNNLLKQTLAEIKEIAKQEIDSKEFMIVQCMLNGSVDDKNKVLKQILQKISECEVKNEI